MADSPASKARSEPATNKACDYCRSLKVKCVLDESAPKKNCFRCAELNRPCTFAVPQRRKPRKRTDSRVAALERQVREMQAILTRDKNAASTGNRKNSGAKGDQSVGPTSNGQYLNPFLADEQPRSDPGLFAYRTSISAWSNQNLDVVSRGVLSEAKAAEFFATYRDELAPHFPCVTFPAELSIHELRHARPILFLAVIATAAWKLEPEVAQILSDELAQCYANRLFIHGEKSLELVQALLVTAIWYYQRNGQYQTKFYELIHMATTMAIDIGLGSKDSMAKGYTQPPLQAGDSENSEYYMMKRDEGADIERCRTMLACYTTCYGVSANYRRPNLLKFSKSLQQCIDIVSSSPDASIFDKRLAHWAKLHSITEELSTIITSDESDVTLSLYQSRLQIVVQNSEKNLESWYKTVPPETMNAALVMVFHYSRLLLHEIAFYDENPHQNFEAPYLAENVRPTKIMGDLTSHHIDALAACVTSAQALIDTFLAMDTRAIRGLPIVIFVRLTYACFVLSKIDASIESRTSKIGSMFNHESLKLEYYYPMILERLDEIFNESTRSVPSVFHKQIRQMAAWRETPVLEYSPLSTDSSRATSQLRESSVSSTEPCGNSEYSNSPHQFPDNPNFNYALNQTIQQPWQTNDLQSILDIADEYNMDFDTEVLMNFAGSEVNAAPQNNWSVPYSTDGNSMAAQLGAPSSNWRMQQ